MVVKVRRPRAIVFDILGTASKSGFLEKILFPFLKVNLEAYINTHWNKKEFMALYKLIQEQSVEFNQKEPSTPVVAPHDSTQGKQTLLDFINFVTENGVNSPAVTQLRFKVWFEGYQQSKIRTPIYSDVPNKIRRWFAEGVKFYVFSNTWVEAQKALLKNTNHGDLTNLISGHYDNDFGLLTEVDSWKRLTQEIGEQPNDVLFLTKSPLEGRAASEAGIAVVLVLTHRHNVRAISHEDRQLFPHVRTLNDLGWIEGSMMPASTEPSARTSTLTGGAAGASGKTSPVPTAISAASSSQPPLATSMSATPASASSKAAMVDSAHGAPSSGAVSPPTSARTASQVATASSSRASSRASSTRASSHQSTSHAPSSSKK